MISQNNNKIAFVETGSPNILTAEIPVGTHDSTSVLAAVGAAMTAAGTQTYNVSYNDTTRRLSISLDGGRTFKLLSGNCGSSAFLQLGVDKSNDSGYYSSITLFNVMNLSASQPVLLTSRTLNGNRSVIYVAGIDSDINVLCSMNPDSFGDVITWTNPDTHIFTSEDGSALSSVDFQLVDSSTLRALKTNSPVVVTLGVFDDALDMINMTGV
ncbi:hypothetical protein PhCBS80983_g06487 [Powellomyces hirtus]|uniref:Uncharacterized protein n=1 Tax=Powellomyces hirtus TaxID=109895 RepID=A0A507DLH7_9FUNG|nr:hypothetical protein PhCBS80983_g06487 [Powellomyces hirtus]